MLSLCTSSRRILTLVLTLAGTLLVSPALAQTQPAMSFFITSVGPGNGADLGGLAGADAHCQALAAAAGVDDLRWRAYLSAVATDSTDVIHAKDRIGAGPWHNAMGVLVAEDLASLHGSNNLTKETAVTEAGEIVNGRGDSPNRHDILTGSNADGTLAVELTCGNWTSSGAGSAQLGHHDRTGGGADPTSWNSAHASSGCSAGNLRGTGGDGLFYCFALPATATAVRSASWGQTKAAQ